MVQVSYPGVYIQEVPSGVRTITAVSTSIAAFIGRASKGKMDKPERILGLADFTRKFGAPHPENDLAYSVTQFFENGGSDCYVIRIAQGGEASKVTLKDKRGTKILIVTAKSEGTWGDTVRMEIDYDTVNPDELFNMTVIHEELGNTVAREVHNGISMDPDSSRYAPEFLSQSSELIDVTLHGRADLTLGTAGFSQGRIFKTLDSGSLDAAFVTEFESIISSTSNFDINVDDTGYIKITLSDDAISGSWDLVTSSTNIENEINLQLAGVGVTVSVDWETVGDYSALRISSNTPEKNSVKIRRSNANDFAVPMMLGLDQGGIEVSRHNRFRPVPSASYYHDIDEIMNLAALQRDDIQSISIDGDTAINFSFSSMTPSSSDPWILDSNGNGNGVREKLRAIVAAVNDDPNSDWKADLWGYHLTFSAKSGSINKAASNIVSGTNIHLGDVRFINNSRQYTLGGTGTSIYSIDGVGGSNGSAPLIDDYKGTEADQTGMHALDAVDLFNLLVLPNDAGVDETAYQNIVGSASSYCAGRRAFYLADGPASWTSNSGRPQVVGNTPLINSFRSGMVKDHSAVFYPFVKYLRNGLTKKTGASGAIAGLMARTDSNRGVWKAPAGVEAGIRGITGIDVELTDAENGVLNKKAVNCIRVFPNGIVNWGARTLDGDDDFGSEWKYIPVRRLALMIEESLFRGTKWVVFEPNDEPLWAKIRLNVGAFMMSLFRQGAFQGSGPKDAYFVTCDSQTTTQDDINKGIVNIRVGFAPLKPAEFVVITIQQMIGDL